MSKAKRRTKTDTRRGGKSADAHRPTHGAAGDAAEQEPGAQGQAAGPHVKPPAKNLPLLVFSAVLLVLWLCVLAYLAFAALGQQGG